MSGGATADGALELLRHTLATVAYRGGKAVRSAAPEVAAFRASASTRTPVEILAHIGDLFDWALTMANGHPVWHNSTPMAWDDEVERFFRALTAFDARLASEEPLGYPAAQIFQGPLADALTHIGQIALLRRMAGNPVKGENYFKATITAGRVGADQATPRVEFD